MPTISMPRFLDMFKKQPTEKELNTQRVNAQYQKEASLGDQAASQKQFEKNNLPSLIFVTFVFGFTLYGYFSQEFVSAFFQELLTKYTNEANLFVRTPTGILILAMFIYILALTKFPSQTNYIQTKINILCSKIFSLLQR